MDKKVTFHLEKNSSEIGVIIRMSSAQKRYTKVGTDIEEVKRLNRQSGLSYNEVKLLLAQQFINQKK